MIEQSWFILNDWERHNDNVYEAKQFLNPEDCKALISYMDAGDSSCSQHRHVAHTHENQEKSDTYFWDSDCFKDAGEESAPISSFDGMTRILFSMEDAANRYTDKPMKLVKAIMHRYGPGAAGPLHSDVYPLATLLYLNDDYEGGEIYFESGLELKPAEGSLLCFDGGGINRHGVRQNTGRVARYVLVAFWEYEHKDEQVEFWNIQSQEEDERNTLMTAMVKNKSGHDPNASILFPNRFPILRVSNFIDQGLGLDIVNYLNVNDINPEETWGPVCFREYWKVAYPDKADELPIYTPGIDENTLPNIFSSMQYHAAKFMEVEEDSIRFSKFKGHNHVNGASTPPHTHGPAVVVAHLVLHGNYAGGEIHIPKYGIEFRAEPNCLYIFSEEDDLKHGIRRVTSGARQSLIAHWQDKDHHYNKAGANI